MKRLYTVGNKHFENKQEAKAERNKVEGYTPSRDKDGVIKPHVWKTRVRTGPDHWMNQ